MSRQYKLVLEGSREVKAELFDLDLDPGETRNIISERPKLADQLMDQLRTWQRSVLESLSGVDYQR